MGRRIAIIGSGLAGLTAAYEVKKAGIEPVVYEAKSQPGGRSRSVFEAGIYHDLGAWTFTDQGMVYQLARQLGLGNQLAHIPTTIGRPINGNLRISSFDRMFSFVGKAFTMKELIIISRILIMARTMREELPDESALKWASRHFPRSFISDVLEPLAGLYFLQSLDTLSRNALLSTIRYLSTIKLYGFKKGMGYMASFLASGFKVNFCAKVAALKIQRNEVMVVGDGFNESVNGVIIATPLPETIRLLEPYLSKNAIRIASKCDYASTIVIRLLQKGQWPKIALQVLPPRKTDGYSCGLTVERAKYKDRVSEGYELVSMYAKPSRISDLNSLADKTIFHLFTSELSQWLGIPPASFTQYWVHRWHHAAAMSSADTPANSRFLEKTFKSLGRNFPIWVAGDFLGSSGLEGAVSSAKKASVDCLECLSMA